jgi:hypothetical protein
VAQAVTVADDGQRQTIGGQGQAREVVEFLIDGRNHLTIYGAQPANLVREGSIAARSSKQNIRLNHQIPRWRFGLISAQT